MNFDNDPLIKNKCYLGDGVYMGFDGYQIWLGTLRENGWNAIAMDENMLVKLVEFSKERWEQRGEWQDPHLPDMLDKDD